MSRRPNELRIYYVVLSFSSVIHCLSQIFPLWHLWLAKQMNQLLVPRCGVGWVLKITLYLKSCCAWLFRAAPLYFHQLCVWSYVISQKIRLPVHSVPWLFRWKISFCSVAGSQRKRNSSLLNQLTDYINYYSMWVSAIPAVTARFPSVWVGYCDLCTLPEGRSTLPLVEEYTNSKTALC